MAARRLAALLALALGVGLGGAACGGGGGSGSGTGATDTGVIGLPAETVGEAPPPAVEIPAKVVLAKGKAIGPGSKGARVKRLQKALRALGYGVGVVDGQFGPRLEQAISKFQTAHDLTADGVAGKQTVKLINRDLNKLRAGEG
jgi:peptidoglycan hydrolase-like protein with peptidoglycan-binding domain